MHRIEKHSILPPLRGKTAVFFVNGKKFKALEGEILSSAMFANGLRIFGRHPKDGSPQGIFCANGQCAQCAVLVNGAARKACITPVEDGMKVETLKGLPELGKEGKSDSGRKSPEEMETDVLIIGGGPSGLSAAAQLGKLNVSTLVVDDKHRAGGKLVLQTHKFFGSVEDCRAGTRGIKIAEELFEEVGRYPSARIWLNSTCLGIFSDKKAGIIKDGKYIVVKPKVVIVAAGAREKSLAFPGGMLPGVYGAGAFQTLVNRDLVKPSEKLFVLGAGNVGLIAAYHAVQAGIEVVGIAETMPEAGGYKVHAGKIKRLGIPIWVSHTVVSANGKESLESVTICQVDENFKGIKGKEKTFTADTLLVAVGLNPVDEFCQQAREARMTFFSCGDAREIAEASAAMFSGKIAAHKTLQALSIVTKDVPKFWEEKLSVLKSRPGRTSKTFYEKRNSEVYPVIHCFQEIPCDPCARVCPKKSIKLSGNSIMSIPKFDGECIGCLKCLQICPGLAITLVDKRKNPKRPLVYLPFEISESFFKKGDVALLTDIDGKIIGESAIEKIINVRPENMLILQTSVASEISDKVASVRIFRPDGRSGKTEEEPGESPVVCRCERVREKEIVEFFENGGRDLNQLKALTRAGMGACQGKTCRSIIKGLAKKHCGGETADFSHRPPFAETPLGQFSDFSPAKKTQKDWSDF